MKKLSEYISSGVSTGGKTAEQLRILFSGALENEKLQMESLIGPGGVSISIEDASPIIFNALTFRRP